MNNLDEYGQKTATEYLPMHPSLRLMVIIHEAEEGGYWAEVPGFPGCVSEGDTLDDVRANIAEAFWGVLETMQGQPVQAPVQTSAR